MGDWFKYQGKLVWSQADAVVPFPPNEYSTVVKEYNEIDWYRYTVASIAGGNVTFEVLTHWSNGTETTTTLVDDMENSQFPKKSRPTWQPRFPNRLFYSISSRAIRLETLLRENLSDYSARFSSGRSRFPRQR